MVSENSDFKDWKREREDYKKAIKRNPNDKEAFFNLGVIYSEHEKDIYNARQCFEKVLEIDAEYVDAYTRLGAILKKSLENSTERSRRLEECFLETVNGLDYFAKKFFGLVMVEAFEADKSKKTSFRNTKEAKLVRANIHYRVGVILQDLFEEDGFAEEEYGKAIALHDNYSSAHYRLALIADDNIRKQKVATEEFEKALGRFRENPDKELAAIYSSLALVLYNEFGDYKRVRNIYERIIEKDDRNALTHYNLGVVCRDKFGEGKKGKRLIDRAFKIDSALLGWIKNSYEQRLSGNPDEVSELYELGVLLKDYLGESRQGQEFIDKAIKLNPIYLVTKT